MYVPLVALFHSLNSWHVSRFKATEQQLKEVFESWQVDVTVYLVFTSCYSPTSLVSQASLQDLNVV